MSHRTISLTPVAMEAWNRLRSREINCSEVCQEALIATAAGTPNVRKLALDISQREIDDAILALELARERDAELRNQLAIHQLEEEMRKESEAQRVQRRARNVLMDWPGYPTASELDNHERNAHVLLNTMEVAGIPTHRCECGATTVSMANRPLCQASEHAMLPSHMKPKMKRVPLEELTPWL